MQTENPTLANKAPNRLARWRWRPTSVVANALLIGIAFLMIYPTIQLIALILRGDDLGGVGLGPGIEGVLWNTFVMVASSSVIALIFSTALALIAERTDGGLPGIGNFMPVAPLMLPSVTGVLGWVVLFDPRIGFVNVALRWTMGQPLIGGYGPIDIYTMQGMIFALSIHLVPAIYLITSSALRSLDPAIEEASRISGAGPLRTWITVTLPAIRPAIFEAWLLSIINGIAIFAVPVILGTAGKIEVVSVRIYRYFTDYPANEKAALTLALGMLVVVLALRAAQWKFLPSGRHATIGGRGVRHAPARLGVWRYVTRAVFIGYILISLVLPLIALMVVSLQPFWSLNFSNLSFSNYFTVLTVNPATTRALANSLFLATTGATIIMIIAGYLMLYANHFGTTAPRGRRFQLKGYKGLVDFVTTMPATFPHTLVGVAFILAFSRWPLDIYGTIWILFFAYLLMEIPYASTAARSAALLVGKELSESSRVFRASEQTTMRRILLPLSMPGLAAGWVLVFIHMMGEVTASAILSGTSNGVVGAVLLDLWENGSFPLMTAFALVIWLIATCMMCFVLWLNNRGLERSR
ncbi:iron ABC transporter permease [Devosia sp.]|uniref:ABC transporter permease n=1 Tax=Devosia sp. TaxID=1871048 RepID=UPI002B001454|nr:iron ABC transporter permease [Devosia sp.]